jgi:hypothetical protein
MGQTGVPEVRSQGSPVSRAASGPFSPRAPTIGKVRIPLLPWDGEAECRMALGLFRFGLGDDKTNWLM